MRTYTFARCRVSEGDGHLLDGAPAQGVPLPLGGEQPQLLLLVLGQAVAVPGEGGVRGQAEAQVDTSRWRKH